MRQLLVKFYIVDTLSNIGGMFNDSVTVQLTLVQNKSDHKSCPLGKA